MSYKFGNTSLARLEQAHEAWRLILNDVLQFMDITVICTHRGKEEQNKAFAEKKSKLKWPDSKHNTLPSIAVDIAPYSSVSKIEWNNTKRFGYMAGLVIACAKARGYTVRWGGDWDSDGETEDQNFHDLPHFELVL